MNEEKRNGKNSVRVNIGVLSIIVLLVCQIVGLAFTYGNLTQQVSFNRELIKEYKYTQQTIIDRLDGFSSRLTKIETILKSE